MSLSRNISSNINGHVATHGEITLSLGYSYKTMKISNTSFYFYYFFRTRTGL